MTQPKQSTVEKRQSEEIGKLRALLDSTDAERVRFQREVQSADDRLRSAELNRTLAEIRLKSLSEEKQRERRMMITFVNNQTTEVLFTKYIQRGSHRFQLSNGNRIIIDPANVLYMEETQ